MPVSALPNMDHVYAKWENRAPKAGKVSVPITNGTGKHIAHNGNGMTHNGTELRKAGGGDAYGRDMGRQKWKDKFGSNIQPLRHRRTRDKAIVKAVSVETVQSAMTAQFKTAPTVLPEHYSVHRPFMGSCCSCMPNSQKDLVTSTTATEGMRNILDVRHELRGSGAMARQFATLVYTWRTRTQHKYPELSMATLTNQRVLDVINAELLSEEVKQDKAKLDKRAKQILEVMKSKISNVLTKFTSWFLHHFLSLLLSGIHVNRGQMKMVKTASQRGVPLLFLPLHKSHLDYILITFILTNYEIKSPNIAAGDNLNIPFFSFLMRGLGGFFIRRKLDNGGGKDSIYRSVLHSYMEQLLCHGEFMEFFLEGGRSRTGKALQPKGGLLSAVLETVNTGVAEDVYVVPVSISYEKVIDGNFNNEQMGIAKKKESFFGAIKGIWSALKCHYGNVRVDFCQPFSLKECVNACGLQTPISSPESSTAEFTLPASPTTPPMYRMSSRASIYGMEIVHEEQRQLISRFGSHVIHTCVQSSALMCTNLLAFLFLTKHRKGTTLAILMRDFSWLREEVHVRKRDVGFPPSTSTQEVVCYTLNMLGKDLVARVPAQRTLDEQLTPALGIPSVFEMSYYSNHVTSVFMLESVIVCSVIYLSDINLTALATSTEGEIVLMSKEEILETAQHLCALLQHEFIFAPPCCSLEALLTDTLDRLTMSELLKTEDSQQLESCMENAYDRKWAARLSDSLSWAVDGEDEEEYYSEELLRVNVEHEESREKLRFLHSVLAPFLESYLVTAHHISKLTDSETPEGDFMKTLHSHAKSRVIDGVASYSESSALETLRNAVKAYKTLRILDNYTVSSINMLELHGRYDVRDSLKHHIQMLESLRG